MSYSQSVFPHLAHLFCVGKIVVFSPSKVTNINTMAHTYDREEEKEETIAEGAVDEVLDEDEDEEESLPDLGVEDDKGWE